MRSHLFAFLILANVALTFSAVPAVAGPRIRPKPVSNARLITNGRNGNLATQTEQLAIRPIALTVNGTRLGDTEAALLLGARVYVPLRSVANALHLGLRTAGSEIELRLPSDERLHLRIGSTAASLGKRQFQLPTPVVIVNGRTYIPSHLFIRAFGAVVRYDDASAQVEILARLENRSRLVTVTPPLTGTISNIDALSNPPVLSVISDDRVQALSLRPGTPITIEDLVAGTRERTTLAALHVGDLLTVNFLANGSIADLADSYRSRYGTIAAVTNQALALADGHVIVPSRSTTISLDGAPVGMSGLHVDDVVTVRSNPETLEVREILASRALPPINGGTVVISQISLSPEHALRANEELRVFMRGTPGAKATFNIGVTAMNVPMAEISPGLYGGSYVVVPGASFLRSPVIGELSRGGIAAAPVSAPTSFSAATLPPQIVETAPAEGQTVNNTKAAIYATFTTPTGIPIDPSSITIAVNNRDVSSQALRRGSFVSYAPEGDLPLGPVSVSISVSDTAGNMANYHWSFVCGATTGLRAKAAYHLASTFVPQVQP